MWRSTYGGMQKGGITIECYAVPNAYSAKQIERKCGEGSSCLYQTQPDTCTSLQAQVSNILCSLETASPSRDRAKNSLFRTARSDITGL